MRIVVWNCKGSLHTKFHELQSLRPDIAIVPECARPEQILRLAPDLSFSDAEWTGFNPSKKGLGVFSFTGACLRRHESFNPEYEQFLPLEVRCAHPFKLLAVWAFNRRSKGALHGDPNAASLAFEHYSKFLNGVSVVAGDFNNWYTHRSGSFKKIACLLSDCGHVSAYHHFRDLQMGQEREDTLTHNSGKGFHIDYCFVPAEARIEKADLETGDDWLALSDHSPLVVDLSM